MSLDVCSICRYSLNIPIKLECGHEYCFLCIKSSHTILNECPYCRKTININLNNVTIKNQDLIVFNLENLWVYSDISDLKWWLHNPVTNKEIEDLYNNYKLSNQVDYTYIISIAINNYIIDFKNMKQISKDDNIEKNIKRVTIEEAKKINIMGVANINYTNNK